MFQLVHEQVHRVNLDAALARGGLRDRRHLSGRDGRGEEEQEAEEVKEE